MSADRSSSSLEKILSIEITCPSGENGSIQKVVYELKSLKKDETEIKDWANFCASIFAYKPSPPPAEFFVRHYYNDPLRDASLIRSLRDESGGFAASVQTCRRLLSTGGIEVGSSTGKRCYIISGGIANVCTHPTHRKRGLIKILLKDAHSVMAESGMECSNLHCSPALTEVYQSSAGYRSVTTPWSVISIHLSHLAQFSRLHLNCKIRKAKFPQDSSRLQKLHQLYSEKRFVGCLIRSEDYWNQYIRHEVGHYIHVLINTDVHGKENILAWLATTLKGEKYKLIEFGMDISDPEIISTVEAMGLLLQRALTPELESLNANSSENTDREGNEIALFSLPTSILDDIRKEQNKAIYDKSLDASWIDWTKDIYTEDDPGWMYKMIQKKNNKLITVEDLINKNEKKHLIWPSDSF